MHLKVKAVYFLGEPRSQFLLYVSLVCAAYIEQEQPRIYPRYYMNRIFDTLCFDKIKKHLKSIVYNATYEYI